ncbi:hypothetical protein [Brevundimonas sp.]|uniref:hypothetical protein n=1 Tax=Brevundimonas sp. TaxID=1871086 RepID=UPI003BADAC88
MSRPTPFEAFVGNVFLCVPLMLGAIYVGYLWMIGQASGLAALCAAIVASIVAKAAQRVRAYAAWQRDWENAGKPPRTFRPPSGKVIKVTIGLAIWGWFVWMSQDVESTPAMNLAVLAFWVGTAIMFLTMVVRMLRGPSARKTSEAAVVSACLPAARHSTSLNSATMELPTYCLRLMKPGTN